MLGLLLLVFVVAPIVEIYVVVQVAGGIGFGNTILLLIAMSVGGAWLAKMAGLGVLQRLQRTVRYGKVPSAEVIDGALILLAGALMIAPGFISDGLALLLLFPPTRALARHSVLRRLRSGGSLITVVASGQRRGPGQTTDAVWEVEGWEDPPSPSDRPGLGQ